MRATFIQVLINSLASSALLPARVRVNLLRSLGFRIGRGTVISPACFFGRGMTFGSRCFVNRGCFFNTTGGITVGNDVHLGPGVSLITSSHEIGPQERRAGDQVSAAISIGDGAWIGANVTILPGARIGTGAVVAAGAVVTVDLPDNGLYAGVPAKLVRSLDPEAPLA